MPLGTVLSLKTSDTLCTSTKPPLGPALVMLRIALPPVSPTTSPAVYAVVLDGRVMVAVERKPALTMPAA